MLTAFWVTAALLTPATYTFWGVSVDSLWWMTGRADRDARWWKMECKIPAGRASVQVRWSLLLGFLFFNLGAPGIKKVKLIHLRYCPNSVFMENYPVNWLHVPIRLGFEVSLGSQRLWGIIAHNLHMCFLWTLSFSIYSHFIFVEACFAKGNQGYISLKTHKSQEMWKVSA